MCILCYSRMSLGVSSAPEKLNRTKEEGIRRKMVKLTDEQKAMLEALDKIPDEEIDFSDIPERPIDWSKARIAPFYRPMWKYFSLKLDQFALDCLEVGPAGGKTLDEAVNKALRAQMFRIKLPVRVEKAEKNVRRIRESPEEIESLYEIQKQTIEILYAKPITEVASADIPFRPVEQFKSEAPLSPVMKDIVLNLDENVIDWFEHRLEDGQSLDEVISKALVDHILWIQSSEGMHRKGKATRGPVESA